MTATASLPLTVLCAWCGAHLSGPRLTAADGLDFEVSHGICPGCLPRVEAEILAASGGSL